VVGVIKGSHDQSSEPAQLFSNPQGGLKIRESKMSTRLRAYAIAILGAGLLAGSAMAATSFGSRLNHEPTPPETCRSAQPFKLCTWVLEIGQQNVGHERAPKNGVITKLQLRSCTAGSFALQIARASPSTDQARVVKTGPTINYKGNPGNCDGGLFVETFNINVTVQTGDFLAVLATRVGFIYNASDEGALVFDPPLPDGGPNRAASNGTGDGFLLLRALYND
jgi:hypothetical protein